MDSRLRGNDGWRRPGLRCADFHSRIRGNDTANARAVIPAEAGVHGAQPLTHAAVGNAQVSEATLFALQRLTAKLLAPFVLVHLVLILYAVRGGLSAAEILDRTQGSVVWGAFYALFVVAVAVHAPIGVRNVVREWTRWRGRSLDATSVVLAMVLLALGLRAVAAVVA